MFNFKTPDGAMVVQTVELVAIAVFIGVLLSIILKITTHRIYVEKCYKLKSGTIIRGGRYKEYWDKELKLKYLLPMTGKERLPGFPSEAYQKVWGVPLIGIRRHLILDFPNKKSPIAIVPNSKEGKYVPFHTIKHYVEQQDKEFIKKFNQQGFFNALQTYAPIVIIFCSLAFWGYQLMAQSGIYQQVAAKIDQIANTLIKLYGGL